jgi:hypothetical protein
VNKLGKENNGEANSMHGRDEKCIIVLKYEENRTLWRHRDTWSIILK